MSEGKRFGPYAGNQPGGGRPIYVYKKKVNGVWKTTSKSKARADYEAKNGKLPKNVDVDHKDNNKHNDSASNLRAISHKKNVAKENKRRAGKKENEK